MKHNIFELFWKSRISITKATIDDVLNRIDKEISYLSTIIIPKTSGRTLKSILKQIEELRSQKTFLEKKSKQWDKSYDEDRFPTEAKTETCDSEKTYGLHEGRINLSTKLQKGRFAIEPYDPRGGAKAHELQTFDSKEEADEFINNMGSRWVMYLAVRIIDTQSGRVVADYKEASREKSQIQKESTKSVRAEDLKTGDVLWNGSKLKNVKKVVIDGEEKIRVTWDDGGYIDEKPNRHYDIKVSKSQLQKPGATIHSAKFDRCVEHVKRQGGAKNPYAVCMASLGDEAFKSVNEKLSLADLRKIRNVIETNKSQIQKQKGQKDYPAGNYIVSIVEDNEGSFHVWVMKKEGGLVDSGGTWSNFSAAEYKAKELVDEYKMKKSQIKKFDCVDKKAILKQLYRRAWGTTAGLNATELEKMSEDEIDEAIKSLESIFNN